MDLVNHLDSKPASNLRGLEVISADNFQVRRHLADSQPTQEAICVDCSKEQNRNPASVRGDSSRRASCGQLTKSTPKWLHKSKSPIVLHLEQAILKSSQKRFRKIRNSCEIDSASSTDTEDGKVALSHVDGFTSLSAKHRKVFNRRARSGTKLSKSKQTTKPTDINNIICSIQKASSVPNGNVNKRTKSSSDSKRVTLDEEVHEKFDEGLQEGCVHMESKKMYSEVAATPGSPILNNKSRPHSLECRKLTNKENVNVVCNDLHSQNAISNEMEQQASREEKDDLLVESSSSVNSHSSTDCESTDGACSSDDSECRTKKSRPVDNLSKRALARPLYQAKQNTGNNYRERTIPSQHHAQQYTHYFAQDSDLLHIELLDEYPDDITLDEPPIDSRKQGSHRSRTVSESLQMVDEIPELEEPREYRVVQLSPTKVQVSLAKSHKRIRAISAPTLGNSRNLGQNREVGEFKYVSIDLTNTGWTYTVEYHVTPANGRKGRSSQHAWQNGPFPFESSCGHARFNPHYTYQAFQPIHCDKTIAPKASLHEISFKVPMHDPSSFAWPGFFPLMWMPHPVYPHLPVYLYPVVPVPYPFGPSIPPPWSLPPHNAPHEPPNPAHISPDTVANYQSAGPPDRPWIVLQQPDTSRPVAIFTVMCYNVLCDKYCTRQLYGYCPSWALLWDYRKKFIIEDIRNMGADIIALQEVETEQFYNFFLPELKHNGYDGIFSPKSRAKTMRDDERKHVDGCAIFYRTNKFNLIKHQLVEFNQLAMNKADGHHDMINRVMTKDNIGLAALFETKEEVWENGKPTEVSQPLLVATCHVHWDPEYSDVKLIQTMMLMSELKNIVQEVNREHTSLRPGARGVEGTPPVPLLLCGDLNSLPNSGVVEYLTMGRVAANHVDFKELVYEDCLQKLSTTENKELYTHDFKLSQAYNPDIMPFTNYTYDFKGVIDYIFFSREHMRPLGVLGPVNVDWLQENRVVGCPNQCIPSDHFPLLTEIEMPAFSGAPSGAAGASGYYSAGGGGAFGGHGGGPSTYLGSGGSSVASGDVSGRHHGNHRFSRGGHNMQGYYRR